MSCQCAQLPSIEDIEAHLHDKLFTVIVFFLDETFEGLKYGINTTVAEATEQIATIIKLQNFTTFTLFECRKVIVMQLPISADHLSIMLP